MVWIFRGPQGQQFRSVRPSVRVTTQDAGPKPRRYGLARLRHRSLAPAKTWQLELAGEEAKAAIVEGPVAVAEEMGTCFADGFSDELFLEIGRQVRGDRATEHIEPGAKAVLAVFERGGAVEEESVGDFEPVTFEQGRVLSDARVKPGARKGLWPAKSMPSSAKSGHDLPDVAFATELCDEATAGFEYGRDGDNGAFGIGDPMERGVGENGVELFGESEIAGVHDFESDGRVSGAGLLDHFWGAVDTSDMRTLGSDLRGKVAGAAADVEDVFARLSFEKFEQSGGHFPDEGVFLVVQCGVPVRVLRHG